MNATLHRVRYYIGIGDLAVWNGNFIFKLWKRSCEDDIFMKDN